ncbi:MAG: LysE family transporter [bacterium]|nr:LysE family transporter [bacterium]
MYAYLPQLLTVALVHLLAVMSPGPDFVMVCRNALTRSRRAGAWSAIGTGAGLFVHVAYSIVGVGYLVSQSILAFSILKWAGAAYLVWIGWKSFRAKPAAVVVDGDHVGADYSAFAAFRIGFLTNVLNPKATLFVFALFTQVIDGATPTAVKIVYGLEMAIMNALWFTGVAYAVGHPRIRTRFRSIQHRFEQAMGAILIALGIKVALAER